MALQSIQNFVRTPLSTAYNGLSYAGSSLFNAVKKHPYATALTIAAIGAAVVVIVRRPEFIEATTSVTKSSKFTRLNDEFIHVGCTKKIEMNRLAKDLAIKAGVKVPPDMNAIFRGTISNQGTLTNIFSIKFYTWVGLPLFTDLTESFPNPDGIYSDCRPSGSAEGCCNQIAEFLKI